MLIDFLRLVKGFILFIGPTEARKTSILRRLVTGEFEEPEPTMGFREEIIAKVRVIEIGGHSNFRKYWSDAIDQKPVKIFFVIDISKDEEYLEFRNFIQSYPEISKITILTANKYDLVKTIPEAIANNDPTIICSAKENDGMLDILESIASMKDKAESHHTTMESTKPPMESSMKKTEEILKEFQGKF